MKRTTVFMSDEMVNFIKAYSDERQMQQADVIRTALEWFKGLTFYTRETMSMLQDVHPEMTPEQIVNWLVFMWRVKHEGKDKKGDKLDALLSMVTEIRDLLKEDNYG